MFKCWKWFLYFLNSFFNTFPLPQFLSVPPYLPFHLILCPFSLSPFFFLTFGNCISFFPFSPLNPITHPFLFFRFMASFFISCYCMHAYICTCVHIHAFLNITWCVHLPVDTGQPVAVLFPGEDHLPQPCLRCFGWGWSPLAFSPLVWHVCWYSCSAHLWVAMLWDFLV